MAQTRRMGVEGSKVRSQFVDAAEAILREEGYRSVTARQVSAKAGLKTQLLYYYFRTMDDLILAVVRQINERRLQRFNEALASPTPLSALWSLNSDTTSVALSAEMTSIASHREAIRTEIIRSAEQFRALQIETFTRLLSNRHEKEYPAAGIVLIAAALARTIVTEASLGFTLGHAEAIQIAERVLKEFRGAETPPAPVNSAV